MTEMAKYLLRVAYETHVNYKPRKGQLFPGLGNALGKSAFDLSRWLRIKHNNTLIKEEELKPALKELEEKGIIRKVNRGGYAMAVPFDQIKDG